ncbi:MAG TPA: T9SS type A sorting domain-containing protein, partial [Puia sp.]|nr:T9SS type A sorting domain-containing protein [Puia sp.]
LFKVSAPLPTTTQANTSITQLIAPTTATPAGKNFAGIAFNPTGQIYMSTDNDLYLLSSGYSVSHIGTFSTSGVGSDITSCNFPFGILAVSWENFSATPENNKTVNLSWKVQQQSNGKGFYVERSLNGTNWDDLAFVASTGATGISVNYDFTDHSPLNGKNYYRIKQVDLDGSENYSEIKLVNADGISGVAISVWPNPAKDYIKVNNNNEACNVRIYNQSGAIMSENKIASGVSTFNVSNFSFGAYIIHVTLANGQSFNQKFIKE